MNANAKYMTIGAALGAVMIAAVVVVLVVYGQGANRGVGQYSPGVGVEVDIADSRRHFSADQVITDVSADGYSVPPTSGRHWGRWMPCGFYRTAVPDERIVHNLEHGHVAVHYNFSDEVRVDDLETTLNDLDGFKRWGLARPYDAVPAETVWMTVWGVMEGPLKDGEWESGARFRRFFDAYAGVMGPEFPNGAPCRESAP